MLQCNSTKVNVGLAQMFGFEEIKIVDRNISGQTESEDNYFSEARSSLQASLVRSSAILRYFV